tara:strand:+ start:36 stop:440 length:405 start_codon:yes stop_codon:yes gene_type:complete
MKKIFLYLIIIILTTSPKAYSSSYKYDEIMDMLKSENNIDTSAAFSYLIGIYDGIKTNENISQMVYGVEARKFCFKDKAPKLIPDLINMMNLYKVDKTKWETQHESFKILSQNVSYVMIWTLISNYQCEHNINN